MARKKTPKNKLSRVERAEWLVSAGGCARFFGVSPATVTTWLDAGMPCVKRGKTRGGVVIDLRKAAPWVAQQRGAEKASSARMSVAHETAERLRIANAEKRREVIAVAAMRQQAMAACNDLREVLEAMPQRVSPDVQIQERVADECRVARSAFASRLDILNERRSDLVFRGSAAQASTNGGAVG
jgi:phage terminase Nu1 subunit (DNA packaging protein)